MVRPVLVCAVLVLGCDGSGDPGDPGGPIDPPEARCDGTDLEVWIDDVAYPPETELTSASSELTSGLSSASRVRTPSHALHIYFDDAEAIRTTRLPAVGIRIDYSLNPNDTFEPPPSVYVTTSDPIAANWSHADIDGELVFAEAGTEPGDSRCASFDAVFTWDIEGFPYRARVRGQFAGEVEGPDSTQ